MAGLKTIAWTGEPLTKAQVNKIRKQWEARRGAVQTFADRYNCSTAEIRRILNYQGPYAKADTEEEKQKLLKRIAELEAQKRAIETKIKGYESAPQNQTIAAITDEYQGNLRRLDSAKSEISVLIKIFQDASKDVEPA